MEGREYQKYGDRYEYSMRYLYALEEIGVFVFLESDEESCEYIHGVFVFNATFIILPLLHFIPSITLFRGTLDKAIPFALMINS